MNSRLAGAHVRKRATLRESFKTEDKIAEIRLSLKNESGRHIIWIFVEGESDVRVYSKFFTARNVKVEFVPGGKGALRKTLGCFEAKCDRMIGIQDADFLHLEKTTLGIENVFLTDCNNLEMMILSFCEIRENLFCEYRKSVSLDKVWAESLQIASDIGYIRWYNEKKKNRIRFDGLGMGKYIFRDEKSGSYYLNKKELVNVLNSRSKDKLETLTIETLDGFRKENETDDIFNLCNGHDVTTIISIIIGTSVSKIEFERHLRISFQKTHFYKTSLFEKIQSWANKKGHAVFHEQEPLK